MRVCLLHFLRFRLILFRGVVIVVANRCLLEYKPMTSLASERLETLESAIGMAGQAIIDLEPGFELDTSALGEAALACFDRGNQDADTIRWHVGRVEFQVVVGALEHLMVQRVIAKLPDAGGLDSHDTSGDMVVRRFQAGRGGYVFSSESIGISGQLGDPTHPLHQVKTLLDKAESTIAEVQLSDPVFLRKGNLELGVLSLMRANEFPA